MVKIPGKAPGPKPSRHLPKAVERELRIGVLDAVEEFHATGGNSPQIIIGNLESGCHGIYFHRPSGTEFIFHHCKMKYATGCKCIARAAVGETTYQIPPHLDKYRLGFILGRNVPFRLEPKLAAMVVMKIFLGMSVPEPLQLTISEGSGIAPEGTDISSP
ncbi:hypothetical protein GGR58DRAFT_520116 [Xylaria digitata]|nr:hypothetical protein GGR58DRAFT_520116 [Xylaria digitata]